MKNIVGKQVVATAGLQNEMSQNDHFAYEIGKAFGRFESGDWGDLCAEDKQLNDEAVESNDDRIVAAYNTSKGKVYIITEWDRSVTTILFADEY